MQGSRNYKPFGLRMPEHLKDWVQAQASKQRRSVNSFLLILIEQAMKEESNHADSN